MNSEGEITSYINEIKNKLQDYAQQIRNESSSSSSSSSSKGGASSKGTDSGYSSDSSDYSSKQKKEPYYEPFTCDYCFYAVPSTDSRPKITAEGKQFCTRSCANLYIQREYDKAEHEKRMNQIREDIRKSDEKIKEQSKKFDQDMEEWRKKSNERHEKWKKEMEELDKRSKERNKNIDEVFLKHAKRDSIKHVKGIYHIWKISDQQALQLLGTDWEQQINNVSECEEARQKASDYIRTIESKKWIIELPEDKEKAIGDVEWYLDLQNVEDEQLNEKLNVKDWREEINACSNQSQVERKKEQLKRKVKKINNDPHRKQTRSTSVNNLDYKQQNYVEKQLSLPSGQSVNEYIRSAKTPEERKQREDEVRTILNKLEQENRKTRAVASIVGVLLIGTIIGLIIYLVKRNKKRY